MSISGTTTSKEDLRHTEMELSNEIQRAKTELLFWMFGIFLALVGVFKFF